METKCIRPGLNLDLFQDTLGLNLNLSLLHMLNLNLGLSLSHKETYLI